MDHLTIARGCQEPSYSRAPAYRMEACHLEAASDLGPDLRALFARLIGEAQGEASCGLPASRDRFAGSRNDRLCATVPRR
jgi:hypothetical protein